MTDGLIAPLALTQFFDNNGIPLAGGFVYFYIPTTTTFKDTWQDGDQGVLNDNPVTLDASGRANIWGTGDYRQKLTDSLGNIIWDKVISLPVVGVADECGPVLYAGISDYHDLDSPDPDQQQCQFAYCNATSAGEGALKNNTMVTFIAGVTNNALSITGFQIWFTAVDGTPPSGLGYSVFKNTPSGPTELEAGDILEDNAYFMLWNEVEGSFILLNPTTGSITIPDHSITNAKLVQITGPLFKGRSPASLGDVQDMSPTTATTMLNALVGDSGSGGTKGLVPAPAAGDAAAGRFLKADGLWEVPPGSGGGGGAPDDATYFLTTSDVDLPNARTPSDTGTIAWDVGTAGLFKAAVVTNSIGSSQLVQIASGHFLGRTTGGTGNVEELTGAQATALLSNMVGDSGSGGTKGLVPAPSSGDAASGKFLKADGSWTAPSGSGAPSTAQYIVAALDGGLSAERAATDTTTVTWDFGTGSQAKANVPDAAITNVKLANVATATFKGRTTAGTGVPEDLTATQATALLNSVVGDSGSGGTKGLVPAPASGDAAAKKFLQADATWARVIEVWGIAFSDETTAITTGTSKVTWMWPFAVTIVNVYCGLGVAQTSGSIFTVDINEAGTTILSTKLTVDNGETTSTTAATPPVISDSSIAAGALMSADVDQVGDGTAKGGKIYIEFTRT